MNQPLDKDEALKTIQRAYKPGIFNPIFLSLVCVAPYLWLFIDIADKRYDRLNMLALLSGICISVITWTWTHFVLKMKEFKKETKDYLRDPEKYEW